MVRGMSLDGEDLELPYEDLELPVSHGEPKDSQRLPYDAADTDMGQRGLQGVELGRVPMNQPESLPFRKGLAAEDEEAGEPLKLVGQHQGHCEPFGVVGYHVRVLLEETVVLVRHRRLQLRHHPRCQRRPRECGP